LAFTHPTVQHLRRLLGRRSARLEAGVVVVEGPTLLGDAVAAGWTVTAQFVAAQGEPLAIDAPVHRLAPGVVERVATTETPQSVIGVVTWPFVSPQLLDQARFVVVAHELADPGNAGTVLRSAEASGVDAVVFTPGSVDVRNPKVVRASAGAIFRVPVITDVALEALRHPHRMLWGTSSHHGVPYDEVDFVGPTALVVGNEARGVPDDAPVDAWVTIPHRGRSESLNVAMAATVLCFEVSRQRRRSTGTVTSR
jgi:TrmH family RNA methyltransferase